MYYFNTKKMMVIIFLSFQLLTAMEERYDSLQEGLPSEINLYVTQFLGSTLAETLRNIATLSQVDKYFNSLIVRNPKFIGRMLQEKFGDERLVMLEKALINDDARIISKLMSMNIINADDLKNKISTILDRALETKTYNVINYLYDIHILNDNPLIRLNDSQLVTPFDYLLQKEIQRELLFPLIIDMIEHGANVNQQVTIVDTTPLKKIKEIKKMTLLEFVLQLGELDLFGQLLMLGADPTIKNEQGFSVIESFEGAPAFARPYIDVLEKHGFKVSMRVNNKRGRMFTVHQKKIQYRNRSIARNSRKYTHQSI